MICRNQAIPLVALTVALIGCGSEPTDQRRSESPNRVVFDQLTLRLSVELWMPVEQLGRVSFFVDGAEVALSERVQAEPEWANDSPEARYDADVLALTRVVNGEVTTQLPILADRIDGPRLIELRAGDLEEVLRTFEVHPWGFCGSEEVAAQLVEVHRTFGGLYEDNGWSLMPGCAYCRYDDPSLDREYCQ